MNEKDINERLNNEGGIMQELTEEEMKCEGGACKKTNSYRRLPGYEHIVTGGRPGTYEFKLKTAGSAYELVSWKVKNSKNILGGSANYKVIDRLWIKPYGKVLCHTPSGLGTCQLELEIRDILGRKVIKEIRNIQFIER